jgi:hypothetical protein
MIRLHGAALLRYSASALAGAGVGFYPGVSGDARELSRPGRRAASASREQAGAGYSLFPLTRPEMRLLLGVDA